MDSVLDGKDPIDAPRGTPGADRPHPGRPDPLVPVFGAKNYRSWPKSEEGGRAWYMPLSKALAREFRRDVHAAAYSVPERLRRLGKQIFSLTVQPWIEIPLVLVFFDVDDSSHKSAGGTGVPLLSDDWWLEQVPKIKRILGRHAGGYVYRTRGGYRVVYVLAVPVVLSTADDAENWRVRYLGWVAYLAREFDVHADPSCAPWNWLFRLPHATRDKGGRPERRETIGDPTSIGAWSAIPSSADVAAAENLRKRKSKRRSARREEQPVQAAAVGDGALFHAFKARGWLGAAVEPGKWAVVCPNESAHTGGERYDTSTVLYAPGAGEVLGWVHCSHAHCQGRDIGDVLKVFSKEEMAAARAAAGADAGGGRSSSGGSDQGDLPQHLRHVLKHPKLCALLRGESADGDKSPRSVDLSFLLTAALLGIRDAGDLERLLRHRLRVADRDAVADEPGYVETTVLKALARTDEIREETLDPLLRGFRILRRVPEGDPDGTTYRLSGQGWAIDLDDATLLEPKVVVREVLQQTGRLAEEPKRADWLEAVRRALETRSDTETVSPEHGETGLLTSIIAEWLRGAHELGFRAITDVKGAEADAQIPWPHQNADGDRLFTMKALFQHLALQAGLRVPKHHLVVRALEKLGAAFTQRRIPGTRARPRVWVISAVRLGVNTCGTGEDSDVEKGRDTVDGVDDAVDRARQEGGERHVDPRAGA